MCMYNLIDDKRHGSVFNGTVGELTDFLTENFSRDNKLSIDSRIDIITDESNNIGFSIGRMDCYGIPGFDNESSKDNNQYLCLWVNFDEMNDVNNYIED